MELDYLHHLSATDVSSFDRATAVLPADLIAWVHDLINQVERLVHGVVHGV